jgi:hypothetical protein
VLRQVGHLIEHTRERVRRQGLDPDKLPWDYGKLLEELKPGAEKAVRRSLVLEAIAEKEGLTPTDVDIDAEVEKIAVANSRPAPAVRRIMTENGDLEGYGTPSASRGPSNFSSLSPAWRPRVHWPHGNQETAHGFGSNGGGADAPR